MDHYSKYNYLEYELFRNNQLIGYHKYTFNRNNENLQIDNKVSFKITKLGIDLYKYQAEGVESIKMAYSLALIQKLIKIIKKNMLI